ncbi:uncharacterized protein IL334_006031 [Kwoniella shivajii]|uniref:Large ribosomal subunit protein bL21m n=1 Tax=Kwoniella shivajii TaxID=564305 RepID=A0ABZ1D543_9TREE|nr:hypothetical protein IL334_006031 [Kwoniella shivajii]
MPPRPSITSSFARMSLRGLQTTAPLPPPTTPLPPINDTPSSSSSSSSSSFTSALSHLPPILPSSTPESTLPSSTSSALSLLSSQSTSSNGRYILARLHSRTYLLHPRDILTLPTLKPLQSPGSTLNLTKIIEVGSRDYAIKSQAASASLLKRNMDWKEKRLSVFENIPNDLVNCQLTVLEHTKSPMERILKKKRRKGYKKTIEHKQGWTRLRVGDIHLGQPQAQVQSEAEPSI